MKGIAKLITFTISMACFCVPLIVWFGNPELTQMQVFKSTWMWSFYAVIVLIIGIGFIDVAFKEEEK